MHAESDEESEAGDQRLQLIPAVPSSEPSPKPTGDRLGGYFELFEVFDRSRLSVICEELDCFGVPLDSEFQRSSAGRPSDFERFELRSQSRDLGAGRQFDLLDFGLLSAHNTSSEATHEVYPIGVIVMIVPTP
jgi:hypothetical protein